jgi:acetoin utilization protein AcuC
MAAGGGRCDGPARRDIVATVSASPGPLLVFGPWSVRYDFGPSHPLTPRRFGPGIDLLRLVGAEPGLAPEPAAHDDLRLCHTADYIATVGQFSIDPDRPPSSGIGHTDNPPFAGMHDAAAAVAGGSLRAIEAILRGDVEHAFHPGGGLHHAMPSRAAGFCIYDDPALAIVRARGAGHRVLYVDLDVHHGDGVQAIFADDPGVLTLSFHESGRYLFPGTGYVNELGSDEAAGTSLNVPLEPGTGEVAWLRAVRALVPAVAAAFGPSLLVTQHGCDSHAWDPLPHLRVTTTAMGEAARLCDTVAHRWAGGRWLSTGGGGYAAYSVVPRVWSLVWLAGAHRDVPAATDPAWRRRWEGDAARFGDMPPPATFDDEPNAGLPVDHMQEIAEERSTATADLVTRVGVPRLLGEAIERGWLDPLAPPHPPAPDPNPGVGRPAILERVPPHVLARMVLAERVIAPFDPVAARSMLLDARDAGAQVTVALEGTLIVGVVVSAPSRSDPLADELLAIGVAPAWRRRGLATQMLAGHVAVRRPGDRSLVASFGVAERDPVEPLPGETRARIARRLLESAGFRVRPADPPPGAADRFALDARLD